MANVYYQPLVGSSMPVAAKVEIIEDIVADLRETYTEAVKENAAMFKLIAHGLHSDNALPDIIKARDEAGYMAELFRTLILNLSREKERILA